MCDKALGAYVSEYFESIVFQPYLFIQSFQEDEQSKYVLTNNIVQRTPRKCITMNNIEDFGVIGRFAQMDYVYGENIDIDGHFFSYLAFYFSSFDKKNIVDACVPREENISLYTFCIKVKVCDTRFTFSDLAKIAQRIRHIILHTVPSS